MNERDILNLNNRITEIEEVVQSLVISSIQENAKTTKDFKNKVEEISTEFYKIVDEANKISSKFENKIDSNYSDLVSKINKLAEDIKKVKTIKGDKGDAGKDYILTEVDKEEIASLINVPVVEKIIEKTEVIKEIEKEIDIKKIASDLPEESVNISVVKGLRKLLQEISQTKVGQFVQNSIPPLRVFSNGTIARENVYSINFTGATVTPTANGVDVAITGGGGGITSVVAGTNILVDNTNPSAPIINSLSDRYRTTSTTSQTIVPTGTLTFTVAPNLSYTTQQDVIIAFDANNHMHGQVVSYSGTTLVVNIAHKTGSGTYASWTINLDGVALSNTSWGTITGDISLQTDLQNDMIAKAIIFG